MYVKSAFWKEDAGDKLSLSNLILLIILSGDYYVHLRDEETKDPTSDTCTHHWHCQALPAGSSAPTAHPPFQSSSNDERDTRSSSLGPMISPVCPLNTWHIMPPWALLPRRKVLPLWRTESGPHPVCARQRSGDTAITARLLHICQQTMSSWQKPLNELSPQMLRTVLQSGFIFLFNIYFYDFHNLHD